MLAVVLIGIAGRQPPTPTFGADGGVRAAFLLVTTEAFPVGSSGGDDVSAFKLHYRTEYHHVVADGALAEWALKQLKPRQRYLVQGRLRTWTHQHAGTATWQTDVLATSIQHMGALWRADDSNVRPGIRLGSSLAADIRA